MFKLALGIVIGYQIGTRLSGASLDDVLGIARQALANEKTADLLRAGAAAIGDGIRTLGAAVAEEVPARLAERAEMREAAA